MVWSNNLWLKTVIFPVEPKLEAINIIHVIYHIYLYIYIVFAMHFAKVSVILRLTFIWGVSVSLYQKNNQRILPKL